MSSVLRIITETLVPVFFVLGLGFYAGVRRRVDKANTASINVLLMHFALPCSLFLGIARTPAALLRSQGVLIAVVAIAMGATYALQFYLNRRVFRFSMEEAAVGSLTSSFSNNVAVGLPLLMGIYGPPGVAVVAVGILIGALLLSPITLVVLERRSGRTSSEDCYKRFALACLEAFKKPIVFAPLAGLALLLTGFRIPATLASSLDLIGKCTVGVALFLTGLLISAHPLCISTSVLTGVLIKNFVQPLTAVALVLVFRLSGDVGREAFLLTALPAGFFGTLFGARYGVSSVEINSILVLSTVISIVTIPVAYLLMNYLP